MATAVPGLLDPELDVKLGRPRLTSVVISDSHVQEHMQIKSSSLRLSRRLFAIPRHTSRQHGASRKWPMDRGSYHGCMYRFGPLVMSPVPITVPPYCNGALPEVWTFASEAKKPIRKPVSAFIRLHQQSLAARCRGEYVL